MSKGDGRKRKDEGIEDKVIEGEREMREFTKLVEFIESTRFN